VVKITAITTRFAARLPRVLVRFAERPANHRRLPGPHHGTARTCQYVVLLVYPLTRAGQANPPRVLTAHTYEQTTRVTLHRDASVRESEASALMSALVEAAVLLAPSAPTRACLQQEVGASTQGQAA
jgi:hypothetical protein